MEWLTSPEIWIAFFTLTALEIVLGIDNIIMISILVGRMPKHLQPRTRFFGLAMVTRILLLLSITWVMRLTADLFHLFGQGISGRDLILFFGGLFLLWKSSSEIYQGLEGEEESGEEPKGSAGGFIGTIIQIAIIDIVFSLDSVITAVGMVSRAGDGRGDHRRGTGDDALRRRHQRLHRQAPVAEDARPVVPHRGRHGADRRSLRSPCAEGLRLLRHGLLLAVEALNIRMRGAAQAGEEPVKLRKEVLGD